MISIFHVVRSSSFPRSASVAFPGTALVALLIASSMLILDVAIGFLSVSQRAQAGPAINSPTAMPQRMIFDMCSSVLTFKQADSSHRLPFHNVGFCALKPFVRPAHDVVFLFAVPFSYLA